MSHRHTRLLIVLFGPEPDAKPNPNLPGVTSTIRSYPISCSAEFLQALIEGILRQRMFMACGIGPGCVGCIQIRDWDPVAIFLPRRGISSSCDNAAILNPVRFLAILLGSSRYVGRITQALTMVEDGAFDYPPQNARKLSSQLRRQLFVDLGIRNLDLERYALNAVPDRVVRVRDNRPVIAIEKQFVGRLEGDHVLAEAQRLDLPEASQILYAAEGKPLTLLHFAGGNEAAALEIRNISVDCVVRHCLLGRIIRLST